ncbi:MAG: peptide chain release factor 2 [Candidatus Izemoplasmatales bacterium]|jgi:peptide chain release factor 2|nr:peptide chain release factor 2 [Candidatus Izemoplasmatales bacterium]MDD3865297.1 peptide chain release factor 2 [Candidatus Izemoplasmatales bacterium]
MLISDLKQIIAELESDFWDLKATLDPEKIKQNISILDLETAKPDFWSDSKKAQDIFVEINEKKAFLSAYNDIKEILDTIKVMYELVQIDETMDIADAERLKRDFREKTASLRVKVLLNKPYDKFNAILDFHPGSGGTESQDWAQMLLRMYTRWAESKKYKITILDYEDGEEAGLKSATILVAGKNAYGYLKAESGVHRLVRISPFDSAARRHTSFASVSVVPEIDESIVLDIKDEDLKIDVYRSSGNGGQSVNTTDSAVRITHLPTKIVVTCQNERSQIQNRETAMKIIRGKLYQLELEKKQHELDELMTNKVSNSWGSQIRSYVFCPYTMVKDHRTDAETGNVEKVMNGDIDEFITAYLVKYSK